MYVNYCYKYWVYGNEQHTQYPYLHEVLSYRDRRLTYEITNKETLYHLYYVKKCVKDESEFLGATGRNHFTQDKQERVI